MHQPPPAAPLPVRAFQWDLGRQVERLDFLLKWLPRYAAWGYQELYLHLEDAVDFPSQPGVARSDAFSRRQLSRLVAAATAVGIRVVPIVNLLGHTQYLIKVRRLQNLNELRDDRGRPLPHGQVCPLHPSTLKVAADLLHDLAPFCTAGKVHVGLDESFHLGQCPRCRAEVERIGLAGHFAGHATRLNKLVRSYGLRMGLWGDMLALLPAAIPLLPDGVIVYDWYYYPFARHPRVEPLNFAEVDLVVPLKKRGLSYWGCPMNGAFRHEPLPVFGERIGNLLSWWHRCRRVGAEGFLVTSWEPNRLAIELAFAVDAAAASLWLDPGLDDPAGMLRRGFERAFGRRSRAAAAAAMTADTHAFCGYRRWQINDRWDICAGRDGPEPYAVEAAQFVRLTRRKLPIPLAASLIFRRYLARRDVFVRRAARAVWKLRKIVAGQVPCPSAGNGTDSVRKIRAQVSRLRAEVRSFASELRAGQAAARIMWRRSRDPRTRGPNERMLACDVARLRSWRKWLERIEAHPALAWRASPVCGAWQLQFTLHHFAPALQEVVIEQRGEDGIWRRLHAFHIVEFRAYAARPKTDLRREYSVALDLPPATAGSGMQPRSRLVRLRFFVRGAGQVALGHFELTDGVTSHKPLRNRRSFVVVGRRAARRGFPKLGCGRPVEVRFRS